MQVDKIGNYTKSDIKTCSYCDIHNEQKLLKSRQCDQTTQHMYFWGTHFKERSEVIRFFLNLPRGQLRAGFVKRRTYLLFSCNSPLFTKPVLMTSSWNEEVELLIYYYTVNNHVRWVKRTIKIIQSHWALELKRKLKVIQFKFLTNVFTPSVNFLQTNLKKIKGM